MSLEFFLPTLANCYAFRQIFIVVIAKYWKIILPSGKVASQLQHKMSFAVFFPGRHGILGRERWIAVALGQGVLLEVIVAHQLRHRLDVDDL